MKFRLLVKTSDGDEWWEEYDKEIADPHAWARETLEEFNATLKPGERPRELLKIEILDDSNEKYHQWVKRTDGMSVRFRGEVVDLMFCEKCRITGKRKGFRSDVVIDSKFRRKGFQECHTSLELMRGQEVE